MAPRIVLGGYGDAEGKGRFSPVTELRHVSAIQKAGRTERHFIRGASYKAVERASKWPHCSLAFLRFFQNELRQCLPLINFAWGLLLLQIFIEKFEDRFIPFDLVFLLGETVAFVLKHHIFHDA